MNIINRLNDVDKLVTTIIQDYLSLILYDDWKTTLYKYIKTGNIDNSIRYKYANEYNKILEKGIDSYSIKDVDITFMYEIIRSKDITLNPRLEDKLFKYLGIVVDDRNEYKHISYNEDEEELYLMGLLHLCHIRRFLKRFNTYENNVDIQCRANFFDKYIKEVNSLKDILDEERIKAVEFTKEIDYLIESYFASNDKLAAWLDIKEFYMKKPFANIEDKMKELDKFSIIAYDNGIVEAKHNAINYLLFEEKNYTRVEKILIEDFKDGIDPLNIEELLFALEYFKNHNIEKSNEFKFLISHLTNAEYKTGKNSYKLVEIEPEILCRKKIK